MLQCMVAALGLAKIFLRVAAKWPLRYVLGVQGAALVLRCAPWLRHCVAVARRSPSRVDALDTGGFRLPRGAAVVVVVGAVVVAVTGVVGVVVVVVVVVFVVLVVFVVPVVIVVVVVVLVVVVVVVVVLVGASSS